MSISKLNIAVLVQLAGLVLFCVPWGGLFVRASGAVVIMLGSLFYRLEQKRLKVLASQAADTTQKR